MKHKVAIKMAKYMFNKYLTGDFVL